MICAVACVSGLIACGDEKDENDIISADDWTAAFTVAESATRYCWDCDGKCDPEYDFITSNHKTIGYNADEKQYFKTFKSSSQDYIDRYTWEDNGRYFNKQNNEDVAEINSTRYSNYTEFDILERPFVLSFCKDKFSNFKYYSVSEEDGKVEYKATDIEIVIQRDEYSNALSGRGNIYVTFTKEKAIWEIEAFVNTVDQGRVGYKLADIGTYDNPAFDEFTIPGEQA